MKDIPKLETKTADEQLSVESASKMLPVTKPRAVIVGAGFGGLNAARALQDAPVQVTVIDRNNHHLFQPLLYQVATASLSPADISSPIRDAASRRYRGIPVGSGRWLSAPMALAWPVAVTTGQSGCGR